ncbi:MAG: thiamine pyrophosphate-dependent enzyme [Hyphomicrobiaceae bacterium]
MLVVAEHSPLARRQEHHLCPGCGESIAIRLISEVIDEMGLRGDAIAITGVGCHTEAGAQIDIDFQQAMHGRPPSQATGAKRVLPDRLIMTIQGDGDLMSEGTNEAIQAAARGERITIICMNNATLADTGSHMSSATLVGQKTKTTLDGRSDEHQGKPLRFAEILAQIDGTAFAARTSVHSPAHIQRTKKALQKAFETQRANRGLSYVEILTMCPSGWFMSPVEALDFIEDKMVPAFPLGTFKE